MRKEKFIMLLFDILGSIADSAVDKVKETKEEYDDYYERLSSKAENWDDERLKREYAKMSTGTDLVMKAAMLKLMKERGLINN